MRKTLRKFAAGLVVFKAITIPLYAHVQTDWKMALDDFSGRHATVSGVSEFARSRRLERKLKAREMNQERKLMQLSPGISALVPPSPKLPALTTLEVPASGFSEPSGSGRTDSEDLASVPYTLANTVPVVKLKDLKLAAVAACQLSVLASAFDDGSTDADGDALTFTFFEDGLEEHVYSIGTHTIEIEVSDGKNYVRATAKLKVEDKTPPTAVAKDLSLTLDASGAATLTPEEINDGSSDDCGNIRLSLSQSDFSCDDLGEKVVSLVVTDENGNEATAEAIITITDATAPAMPAEYAFTINENEPQGSLLGSILATDNCLSAGYYIKAGNVNGAFSINSNSGELKVTNAEVLDYETIQQFSLTVEATDNSDNAATTKVLITLNNLNDNLPKPEVDFSAAQQLQEDAPYAFKLPAGAFSDADADDVLSYSAPGLPSWLSFDAASQNLSGTALNEDVGSHQITIRATDKAGQYAEQSFHLLVLNTNDAPQGISLDNAVLEENEAAASLVGNLSSQDVDVADAHSYSLVAGTGDADNAYFSIEGDRLLSLRPLNFEEKSVYSVLVRSTDREGTFIEQTFAIQVLDLPDSEPFLPSLFSPNGDGSNDHFILRAYNLEQLYLRITNKQGMVVYETTNIEEATQRGWNGTANGKAQPEGTYIWQLSGRHQDGTPLTITGKTLGQISLIR